MPGYYFERAQAWIELGSVDSTDFSAAEDIKTYIKVSPQQDNLTPPTGFEAVDGTSDHVLTIILPKPDNLGRPRLGNTITLVTTGAIEFPNSHG